MQASHWQRLLTRRDQAEFHQAVNAYLNASVPTATLTQKLCRAFGQLLANDAQSAVKITIVDNKVVFEATPATEPRVANSY